MLFSDDCIRNDKTTHYQDYCSSSPKLSPQGDSCNGELFLQGEWGVLNLLRRVFFLYHKEIIF